MHVNDGERAGLVAPEAMILLVKGPGSQHRACSARVIPVLVIWGFILTNWMELCRGRGMARKLCSINLISGALLTYLGLLEMHAFTVWHLMGDRISNRPWTRTLKLSIC